MVVSAILAGLIGIVLCGVQYARESSRRVQCQNNVRQITLSLIQIIVRGNGIPQLRAIDVSSNRPNGLHPSTVPGNPFVAALKEMSIQVEAERGRIWVQTDRSGESLPSTVLHCPSSGLRMGYRLNLGVEPKFQLRNSEPKLFTLWHDKKTRLAQVSDGLSTTAILSERFSNDGSHKFPYVIAIAHLASGFNDMQASCNSAFNRGEVVPKAEWWSTGSYDCGYDHTRLPNDRTVDCVGDVNSFPSRFITMLSVSARSMHSRVVCVGYLDGSVKWQNEQIDIKVWRAQGTHQGQDIANE